MLSTSSAYDVYLNVSVNATFLNILEASVGSLTSTVTVSPNLKYVIWYIPRFALAASKFTASLVAQIQNNIFPNAQGVICTCSVVGKSYFGSSCNNPGRYLSTSSVSPPLIISIPVLSFVNTISSINTTLGNNLAINEITTLQVNLTVPEVTSAMSSVVALPIYYMMVAFEADTIIGSQIECLQEDIQIIDTNGDSIPDTVTFDFGICVNAWDNIQNDGDIIIITVIASPMDVSQNVNGIKPVSNASMTYGNNAVTAPSATVMENVTFTIVEPNLVTDAIISDRLSLSDAGDLVGIIYSCFLIISD